MSETLTIQYLHKTERIKEKVREPGKFLFFSWSGYSTVSYEIYFLGIQFPNGEEKIFEYDRQKFKYDSRYNDWYPDSADERKRIKAVQQVVNEQEKRGYSVKQDQLALFLNGKIELLIMQKTGRKRFFNLRRRP